MRQVAPVRVHRQRLGHLGTPTELLAGLPEVDRLVALLGDWHQGAALIAWDPLAVARSAFDLGTVDLAAGPDPAAFGGGWIGVWGYQLGAELEALPASPPRPVPQPAHRIGYYDRVLRLVEDEWWFEQLTGLVAPPVAEQRAAGFLAVAEAAAQAARGRARPGPTDLGLGPFAMVPTPEAHVGAVAAVVEHIAAGDVFQANLTARLEATFDGDPLALFCRGVEALSPAYAAFVAAPEGAVASFSPELFLRRRGREVLTSPIKGTAPLTADPRRLTGSGKDRAENVMIVDLMRNDLGRVAVPGSVQVPTMNRLERHAVWHLVSDVTARLRDDVTDGDLLRATFPPGSVTGAPKIRATEVIAELEATGREAYTGAIGHLSPYAGLELNVAIRTVEMAGGRAWLGVGGGIVADSDPRAELAECFAKALPLLDALGAVLAPREAEAAGAAVGPSLRHPPTREPGRDLFETLLVRDGAAVDPGPHLARLAAGVEALGGGPAEDAVAEVVARAVACHAAPLVGEHRLRVDVQVGDDGVSLTSVVTSPLGPAPEATVLTPLVVRGGLGAHKRVDRPELDTTLPLERDQLVLDDDGTVLETGRAAVLAVVGDEVVAPVLDGRQLPSTGRQRVRAVLDAAGLPLVERVLTTADLTRASEVLTVNALRSVVPVTRVEGLGSWPPGPVARWLKHELGAGPRRAPDTRTGPRTGPRRSRLGASARVLFVDNYDSFVYNLVQHATAAGARATVVRNDELSAGEVEQLCADEAISHVVVSPGPGTPEQAGVSVEVVRRLGATTPVLGVCLGHQAIAVAYGADVVRSGAPMHGKPCLVHHDGRGVHEGLPDPVVVARYHSLVVDEATLPPDLVVTARSPSGVVMGVRHRRHRVEGVQWHPESILSPVGGRVLDRFLRPQAPARASAATSSGVRTPPQGRPRRGRGSGDRPRPMPSG